MCAWVPVSSCRSSSWETLPFSPCPRPPGPPAPARPMCLQRAPLVHPVAQGSGPEAGWTLGCVALTPTRGEFQTGKLIRDPSAQPVLTPLSPEGKDQRGRCSPHSTPSPLPSPANISPSRQDRNRRASTSRNLTTKHPELGGGLSGTKSIFSNNASLDQVVSGLNRSGAGGAGSSQGTPRSLLT